MDLNYTASGKFVSETADLVEELEADAVVLLVFGSATKGSGCCCEMRTSKPRRLALEIVGTLRDLADSIERDLKKGRPNENDGYDQPFN
jgi:hypothetical protein